MEIPNQILSEPGLSNSVMSKLLSDLERRREVFQILPQNTLLQNNNMIFGN
jgi:hypothetical protein